MNEFMDLIFSTNEALNVDLAQVPKYNYQEDIFERDMGNEIIDDIRKDAESLKQIRGVNQWKLFIQRNLNNISLDLLDIDKDK